MQRLCRCGCGQPPAKNIAPDGRNKGWLKYAEGHYTPKLNPAHKKKLLAASAKARSLPDYSRRVKEVRGRRYWEIKVPGVGWIYEHRYIMASQLGRALLPSEHVHHRDNDGLNNGLHADGDSNLQLLTHGGHSALTARTSARRMCTCECPNCGKAVKHFAKL